MCRTSSRLPRNSSRLWSPLIRIRGRGLENKCAGDRDDAYTRVDLTRGSERSGAHFTCARQSSLYVRLPRLCSQWGRPHLGTSSFRELVRSRTSMPASFRHRPRTAAQGYGRENRKADIRMTRRRGLGCVFLYTASPELRPRTCPRSSPRPALANTTTAGPRARAQSSLLGRWSRINQARYRHTVFTSFTGNR